jgi:hypothetical protein
MTGEIIYNLRTSGRYKLVYQGGHHDVYCNNYKHITIIGDRFGTSPINLSSKEAEIKLSYCNCDRYRKE